MISASAVAAGGVMKRYSETEEHHDPLTRFFFRHIAFLMRIYGPKDAESIWHYATMFVTIVLSFHIIFVLALIAAFLPGRISLERITPIELGIGIAIVLTVTAIFVDARFKQYRFNMAAASKYDKPIDMLKFFCVVLSMIAAIVGYGLLVGWRTSS